MKRHEKNEKVSTPNKRKPGQQSNGKRPIRYADAGVHIGRADNFVAFLAGKTRAGDKNATGEVGGIGGFAAVRSIAGELKGNKSPVLVMTTDGVGTKLELVKTSEHHHAIGVDLVAMCVNDLICGGARPLFFLDYYATGKLNLKHAKAFADGLLEGCRQAGCSLVGGETAEMPGFYPANKYDVAGFCVGIADENELILPRAKQDSVLIGLPSSGVHANGFSLVRRLIAEGRLDTDKRINIQGRRTKIGNALTEPTRIYVQAIMELVKNKKLKSKLQGVAHITGGGISDNLRRILPQGKGAEIEWDVLQEMPAAPLFQELQAAAGISDAKMIKTFNCGVGMILVVDPAAEIDAKQFITDHGEAPQVIGKVSGKSGIRLV